MANLQVKQGRGAQINTANSFEKHHHIADDAYLEYLHLNGEDTSLERKTKYIEVFPKTIVNKVTSPDLSMPFSMNPYQGCEHGCTYCYARNTHEYWGYSAGSEFEQVILVKKNAARVLQKTLEKRSWVPQPIMLSGNTDCYQPIEKSLKITRSLLEVLHSFKHPAGVITKNALILRDLDLLKEMAQENLIKVSISLTTLQPKLRRLMEPRTATAKKRLEVIETLSNAGVPVSVMMAPIIPGLNSHEIMQVGKAASQAGAVHFNYTMVRLNGQVGEIFKNWIEEFFPNKATKVLNYIAETHGGKISDSNFGRRMRGEGAYAEQIKNTVALVRKKYFHKKDIPFNTGAFIKAPKGQLPLF